MSTEAWSETVPYRSVIPTKLPMNTAPNRENDAICREENDDGNDAVALSPENSEGEKRQPAVNGSSSKSIVRADIPLQLALETPPLFSANRVKMERVEVPCKLSRMMRQMPRAKTR